MAKIVVLYKTPKSAGAFDHYYFNTHVPIAKKNPRPAQIRCQFRRDRHAGRAGAVHLIATLYFDSLAAIHAALASPEGQAAAGDLANFADGGAELYFYETKEV